MLVDCWIPLKGFKGEGKKGAGRKQAGQAEKRPGRPGHYLWTGVKKISEKPSLRASLSVTRFFKENRQSLRAPSIILILNYTYLERREKKR
jgi:hypothetical protein